jgi:outer membrane protein assembly factor BamA
MFTPNDRWFIQGDNRLSWTSLNAFALGADAPAASAQSVKYDLVRLYDTAYRGVGHNLFVGGGININRRSDIRPDQSAAADPAAFAAYSAQHGFTLDQQTSSGTSAALLFDTRDSGINARRGVLANVTYRGFYRGFVGGDSSWREASIDLRAYRALTPTGRRTIAFWMLGDFVTGDVPFLDLPATGADGRSARGYGEGRYRGNRLLYGEVEYRQTVTSNGLFGFVTFLNTTTVATESGERLFDSYAPAAGAGLRFLLNKNSRTNLCADYGWGKQGSRGLYLAIQEAF